MTPTHKANYKRTSLEDTIHKKLKQIMHRLDIYITMEGPIEMVMTVEESMHGADPQTNETLNQHPQT